MPKSPALQFDFVVEGIASAFFFVGGRIIRFWLFLLGHKILTCRGRRGGPPSRPGPGFNEGRSETRGHGSCDGQ